MKIIYFMIITVFFPSLISLQLTHAQEKGSEPLTEKKIEASFNSDLLSQEQIKTFLDNALTIFVQGNILENMQEDIERFLEESPEAFCSDISKQMAVLFASYEIKNIATLLHSIAFINLQFAVSRDSKKKIYLPLTKKTTESLRNNIERTLVVLKFVYSVNDKTALLHIFDKTMDILRLALTTIDGNIRILGYL